MQPNFKRGFNRLFIALTVLWAVYCLVVYPMQKWSEAYKEYGAHIEANCWAARGNELEDCRKYEEISSGIGMWTLKAYYTRESCAYSDDVNAGFRRDVNKRSGDVNKVGAQRRWNRNHA